jgi:hypothetical protein
MTRREQAVVDAAVVWFVDRKPRHRTPDEHLAKPDWFREGAGGGEQLAAAVADLLKWRKRTSARRGLP